MRKILFMVAGILLLSGQLLAQTKTISGKVTGADGNPIPNVSVVVKGTSFGTTSKTDGSYSLSVPDNAKTLVFSSVGLEPTEVSIGNKTSINAQLLTSANELSEVVVQVPYGTVKKTSFTGSESTVTAKSIQKQQVTSVTKALEGLVSGIIVTNGGGTPGSGADIRIRGFGSINANSSPLFVVNGVPYDGSISAISTDEIESVTVLKDATAAALYGSRAANGVIMITTKQGRKGGASVTANIREGFLSRGIPEYDRVGSKDYYELMWEASRNKYQYAQGQSAAQAGVTASNEVAGPNGLVYNAYNVPANQVIDPTTGKLNPSASLLWNESWEDALFRTAARTNANISFSGAGDKSDYFLSMGYLNEEGIMKFTDYKRYNFRLGLNTQATQWLKVGLTIDGSLSEDNSVIGAGSFTSNPFYYSRNMGPIYPIYQHDLSTGAVVIDPTTGKPALDWGVPAQMGTRPYAGNSNLVGSLDLDKRPRKRYNGNANTYMEVKLMKNLTFKSTFGFNILEDNNTTYQNSQFGDAAGVMGRSTKTDNRQLSYTLNEVLTYSRSFGDHSVRVLAGHENYNYRINTLTLTRTGFQFPDQTELDNAAVTESTGGSNEDNLTIESYFAGVNYAYKDKYLVSGSFRRDGSSRFGPNVRWGNFYSAGIGWRISEENFMQSITWLNELKFKASYGEQGNDDIGLFYQYNNYYFADGSGAYSTPSRPANPDLKWEGNRVLNVGFDFAVLSNRLQGTIEYFNRISNNLLFDVPLPISTGNASIFTNIGALKNAGIEVSLGYNVIRKKNFDWRIDLNVTHFKNEITKLPPKQRENGIISGTKKLLEGHSIYDFWIKEYAGVDASTGDPLFYQDILGTNGKPTGERVLTNNVNSASFYYHGSAIPDIMGGVTNSFRYKNFDLSILLTYAYGGKFYDGNYAGLMHSGSYGSAWSSDITQRWQKPGDVTNVPRLQNATSTQDGTSDRFLFDASYVNIKNVQLSYTVSKSVASRLHIAGLQIIGSVDNAYLFTAKKGMDPQRSFTGTADATYPPFRIVTVGINVNLQ